MVNTFDKNRNGAIDGEEINRLYEAIDAGLNAYAAPLGMIEAGADTFAGQIPTILKVNSANSLMSNTAGTWQVPEIRDAS